MANTFKEKYFPTLSLFLICLVTTFLLALVHGVTQNVIEVRAASDAQAARISVMTDADRFELLEGEEALDNAGIVQAVYAAYQGDDLIGYVYDAETTGYSGSVNSIVGVTADDNVISGLRVTQNSETPGLGALAAEPDFYEQFAGRGGSGVTLSVVKSVSDSTSEIEGLTAATMTSNSVIDAANAALELTETLVEKGAGQ